MNIKHLQLNTSVLKHPDKVTKFILDKDIDIACLQEVVYEKDDESPLKKFADENGLYYFEGIHFYNEN